MVVVVVVVVVVGLFWCFCCCGCCHRVFCAFFVLLFLLLFRCGCCRRAFFVLRLCCCCVVVLLLWCCWFLECPAEAATDANFMSRIPFFAYTVLSRYGQGSIKLLKYPQQLIFWYMFYKIPTRNNTPSIIIQWTPVHIDLRKSLRGSIKLRLLYVFFLKNMYPQNLMDKLSIKKSWYIPT